MDLKNQLIKLAHEHPELRPHLLPLLKEAGKFKVGDTVLYGSVRGVIEEVLSPGDPRNSDPRVKGPYGVRLENNNFDWAKAQHLKPLPGWRPRGLKVAARDLNSPEYLSRFQKVLEKSTRGAGKVVHLQFTGGTGWQAVFDTEYAALKVFYAYKDSPNVSFGPSPNYRGWYVST